MALHVGLVSEMVKLVVVSTQGFLQAFLFGVSSMSTSASVLGEGDGTPLQYSCLENPMDGGAY